MGLNDTPRGERLHIGIFGRRNAGKSSLINALTGQNLAIVSDTPGTTTDPVYKAMELQGIGPVVFIDTAGFDDTGELGAMRAAKSRDILSRTDLAILVMDGTGLDWEREWIKRLHKADVPVITVISKWDALSDEQRSAAGRAAEEITDVTAKPIPVSARTGEGIEALRDALRGTASEEYMQNRIVGELAEKNDLVLLVMPQDIQAPKGRLILPQVQTIRELLDRKCTVICTGADSLKNALSELSRAPDLIVTDSQCFGEVYEQKPPASRLTSFSILMAAAKGDIRVFADGVAAVDEAMAEGLQQELFNVLIAEACTHAPVNEDIGTVKIPRLLKRAFGDRVRITTVRGGDFPDMEGLKRFDLIIHCGACMFNRRLVMNRIAAAQDAGVPITNYGIFLAKMAGILDRVTLPPVK